MTLTTNVEPPAPMQEQKHTFAEGYQRLLEEVKTGTPCPVVRKRMKRGQYHFANSVFQPRGFDGGIDESRAHVIELREALLRDAEFPPLVLWWSGKRFYVIDGHHRVMAISELAREYAAGRLKAKEMPAVLRNGTPVEVFEGTLSEAMAMSGELNSRNKLPMSKDDKTERAWRLVSLEDVTLSKAKIASSSGVSERTVANMRERLSECRKADADFDPMALTWKQAKSDGGCREIDDTWEEKQAAAWAKTLGRSFAKKPATLPYVFLRAIELYSTNLYKRIVEHAQEELRAEGDRF